MTEHKGLPVPGYRPQDQRAIDIVSAHKEMEERVLRQIDALSRQTMPAVATPGGEAVNVPRYDPRWLAMARSHIEQGFMALNRAVFRPERVQLPEDNLD